MQGHGEQEEQQEVREVREVRQGRQEQVARQGQGRQGQVRHAAPQRTCAEPHRTLEIDFERPCSFVPSSPTRCCYSAKFQTHPAAWP